MVLAVLLQCEHVSCTISNWTPSVEGSSVLKNVPNSVQYLNFRYLNITTLNFEVLDRVRLSNDATIETSIQYSRVEQGYLSSHTNITSLLLMDTNLSDIEFEPHNAKLKMLTIIQSRLRRVPDSINQLAVLQVLAIVRSLVDSVDLSLFCKLQYLHNINLMHNQIAFLNYSLTSGVQFPTLWEINLSHNLLTTVHLDNFNGMKALRTINLSNNRLHSLDGQLLLASLKKLELSHNRLTELNFCSSNLSNLADLYINNNTLQRMPVCMEETMPSVSYLHLASNALSTDDSIWSRLAKLHQLTLLDISNNRLTSMVWANITLSSRYINMNNNPVKYINISMAIDGFHVDIGCTTIQQLTISSMSSNETYTDTYCTPIRCSYNSEHNSNQLQCGKNVEECKMCV
uniref:Leucine rich immune protein (Coil-less) n=1 Tax=Anopheles quadriannulatus TaxID=34691 RepID=A0A1I8JVT5_ANOQN